MYDRPRDGEIKERLDRIEWMLAYLCGHFGISRTGLDDAWELDQKLRAYEVSKKTLIAQQNRAGDR